MVEVESSLAKLNTNLLHKGFSIMWLQEISTNKSDGDDSELDLDGEISDDNFDGEKAGDGKCLDNQQLTGSQLSHANLMVGVKTLMMSMSPLPCAEGDL